MALTFQPAALIDCVFLAKDLRPEHTLEIWRSSRSKPEEALAMGYLASIEAITISWKHRPIFMFGVVPDDEGNGIVWALGSPDIDKCKKEFISKSREYARYICRHFPVNSNWIDAEYFAGVKWLLFLGATVYEAQPLGDSANNFHYFKFEGGA